MIPCPTSSRIPSKAVPSASAEANLSCSSRAVANNSLSSSSAPVGSRVGSLLVAEQNRHFSIPPCILTSFFFWRAWLRSSVGWGLLFFCFVCVLFCLVVVGFVFVCVFC